jgi:hypothetical protein
MGNNRSLASSPGIRYPDPSTEELDELAPRSTLADLANDRCSAAT